MALFQRFARLLRADLHAALDNLEEPDAVLRQAVRDMEVAQQRQQGLCAQLEQTIQRLDANATALETEAAALNEQLDRCFAAQNDSLIRTVVKRRLVNEQQLSHLVTRREQVRIELQREQAIWQQQSQRLDSLRQQAHMASSSPEKPACDVACPGVISEADVELAILRERQLRGAS